MRQKSAQLVLILFVLCSSFAYGQEERSAFQTGLLHYTNQDLDEAIVALYDAVIEEPANPLTWYYRGLCRLEIGENSGALSDLNKALKMGPNNVFVLLSRAKALKKVGQRQRAINDFERVLYLSPEGPRAIEALSHLGRMNIEQNSYREALENFDTLIELLPEEADAYYFRGLCRAHTDDHNGSISDLNKTLEIDPGHSLALEARAVAQIQQGNGSLACDDLYMAKELGSRAAQDLIDSFCE